MWRRYTRRVAGGLPIPAHFDRVRAGEVWRVDYDARADVASRWASEHGIAAATDDRIRICLLAVDCQNTFCTPGFELFVPGAPGDTVRLCEFAYRNLGRITEIVATLDTHRAMQIFHPAWLVDAAGNHPEPYTSVSREDVERGVWRAADPARQAHLVDYVRALEAGGKYRLTVWPYHAMLGGIGHALVSAFEEAAFFHGIARRSQPRFEVKGDDPSTEHYSALGPDVGGRRDEELVAHLAAFDALVVAGQAKSHCVAWTVEDLLDAAPEIAARVYLLEDCTSPVVVPGAVDFTAEAEAAFTRFASAGVHLVRSTDPLDTWPGFARGLM
jgi:nicotinamidase-related amidase